ncbi:hypothetical protein [Sphingomonas sp. 2SG]|uniref:hypothetical protein n=1 Tax=Sphingomonas sp. 2SG TaxID=2502201 RepID=UPI0010FA1FCF|nr:hypothetical protein [Sphingomonas sp. 2SG]
MRLVLFGMAATLSFVGASGDAQIPVTPLSPMVSRDDPNVIALYTEIMRTIAGVPAPAGRDQLEAQIAYTVDQSQANCPVVVAALHEALDVPRSSKPTVEALRDVLTNASRCDRYGTAAVGGPGATLAQGPAVGIGGGSSNYASF